MQNEYEPILNGISIAAIGLYVGFVTEAGNFKPLVSELSTETAFFEFIVALAALNWAIENDFTGIAGPVAALSATGLALKMAGRLDISGSLRDFAQGRKGVFETLFSLNGKTVKTKQKTNTTSI